MVIRYSINCEHRGADKPSTAHFCHKLVKLLVYRNFYILVERQEGPIFLALEFLQCGLNGVFYHVHQDQNDISYSVGCKVMCAHA